MKSATVVLFLQVIAECRTQTKIHKDLNVIVSLMSNCVCVSERHKERERSDTCSMVWCRIMCLRGTVFGLPALFIPDSFVFTCCSLIKSLLPMLRPRL